jgi:3-hydroxy-9,10-secoandrosta-1,3,5(10)-triene-9,17-dione monooxygenase
MPDIMDKVTSPLVERAISIRDILKRDAKQADEDRRLTDAMAEAMITNDLYKVWIPKRYGGYESDIRTHVDMCAAVSRGNASAGWVLAMQTAVSWMACWMDQEGQDDIYKNNPEARLVGIFTPCNVPAKQVDGGLVISGEWPYATGCLWSDWAEVMVPLIDDQGNFLDALWCFVPMSDLQIKDTWYCMGMKATGSNTLVAENLFVPGHRVVSMLGPKGVLAGVQNNPHADSEPLYRIPLSMAGTICTTGSVIGAAQAALDYILDKTPKRSISYSTWMVQAEYPVSQVEIAEAATQIDTALLHAHRAADDAWESGVSGEWPSQTRRARARYDASYAMRQSKLAVDTIASIAGASGFVEGSELARIYRDVGVATLHGVFRPDITAQLYGQLLLGQPPTCSPIL